MHSFPLSWLWFICDEFDLCLCHKHAEMPPHWSALVTLTTACLSLTSPWRRSEGVMFVNCKPNRHTFHLKYSVFLFLFFFLIANTENTLKQQWKEVCGILFFDHVDAWRATCATLKHVNWVSKLTRWILAWMFLHLPQHRRNCLICFFLSPRSLLSLDREAGVIPQW